MAEIVAFTSVVRRQCYIVRKKKGLLKAFPEYKLYLQQGGSGQVI